ncbi:cation transporter, partial [Bacillus sp. WP8]|uniref:cation transporter n=1 Tax=Bacillus sp. WP8 TaxID=756828 RepID=UPI0037C012E1
MPSFIPFISLPISTNPPHSKHPYPHPKLQNISPTIHTLLIFLPRISIIYQSLHKLIHPHPVNLPLLHIVVMLLDAL